MTRSPSSSLVLAGGLVRTVPSGLRTANSLPASGASSPASSIVLPIVFVVGVTTISSTPIPASP
ncbi:MAG: hypothetical protein E6I81_02370 [Chloroflexi bacterium]|nr:MAG: hypothetical protein E6I81_02370 [Chloroflexota bacterium]